MVDLMAQLFAVVGFDLNAPITMSMLFPWLLKASMAFLIVGSILGWTRSFASRFIGGKL